jgi:hypothetical protein
MKNRLPSHRPYSGSVSIYLTRGGGPFTDLLGPILPEFETNLGDWEALLDLNDILLRPLRNL